MVGRPFAVGAWSLFAAIVACPLAAQDVAITEGTASVDVETQAGTVTIDRIQDTENQLSGEWARTSLPCPPHCIQPAVAASGVATVAELEVLDFLTGPVAARRALLIDTRLPDIFAGGTIPGAVNVPQSTLDADNPFRVEILKALGATQSGTSGAWDFGGALDLMLFCDGPLCDGAVVAVRSLLAAGYPADRLRYYRGGMQHWRLLGLTVTP